jgi:hypothetical protein
MGKGSGPPRPRPPLEHAAARGPKRWGALPQPVPAANVRRRWIRETSSPVRWDIVRREQLGSLVDSPPAATPAWFDEELLRCCARVVAFAGDSDLCFVGRSPEPLFDLLSGVMLDTSWAGRLSILNLSLRYSGGPPDAEETVAVEPYLRSLGLTPASLAARQRAVAFVDVVDSGGTFDRLVHLLQLLSRSEDVEWKTFASRLRFVGLTSREKASPNTWRWQQHKEWVGS